MIDLLIVTEKGHTWNCKKMVCLLAMYGKSRNFAS